MYTYEEDGEKKSFDRDSLTRFIKALYHMKEGKPFHRDCGICYATKHLMYPEVCWPPLTSYDMVSHFSEGWPHHSGSPSYPLGSNSDGMWSKHTEIGAKRWDLVDHLIKRVGEVLKGLE